jgi:hypothetical protein
MQTSDDVRAFLRRLAMTERVSASTQNQAFSAILLFFRDLLRTDLEPQYQLMVKLPYHVRPRRQALRFLPRMCPSAAEHSIGGVV